MDYALYNYSELTEVHTHSHFAYICSMASWYNHCYSLVLEMGVTRNKWHIAYLPSSVVAEGDNVVGVATFHGTLHAAAADAVATLSHIAPFLCHTQAGRGSCSALPCCG
jgi:hypothetical protein